MIGRRYRSPLFILAMTLLIAGAGFLVLRGGYEVVRPEQKPRPAAAVGDSIIALRDGSTIVAERGTLGREMADWLNLRQQGEAKFLLADQPFEPGSTVPTPEAERRVDRFVTMMTANPGVDARIVIFADDAAEALALASRRAERLRADLVSRGLSARRLTVEAQPSAILAPADQASPVRGGQVMIVLDRRG